MPEYASSTSKASHFPSLCQKDYDFRFFVYQEERPYKPWHNSQRLYKWFLNVPESIHFCWALCVMSLMAVILTGLKIEDPFEHFLEIIYNVLFGFHAMVHCYVECSSSATRTWQSHLGFAMDIISYFHYVAGFLQTNGILIKKRETYDDIKIACYYLRMHRPVKFLWTLSRRNPKRSVIGTVLKYMYVFCWMRVTYAIMWILLLESQGRLEAELQASKESAAEAGLLQYYTDNGFFYGLYCVAKMFIPIGPQNYPEGDVQRLALLFITMTGTLSVSGIAVATMAIVLSVYMRTEEEFRARQMLIMRDLIETNVPKDLATKVETFYRMYWHKQRGVSSSALLLSFPPTLATTVYSEIYFEAQQKSRVLRDLSSHFLSELAKVMTTTNYIPGETIIRRNSIKSHIIYITYGDVEDHQERVKKHYERRTHPYVKYKSSIQYFKRNLIDLKELRDDLGKRLLIRSDVFLDVAGCYILRNCSESLAEESDEICLRATFPCILQPASSLQTAWSGFIALLVFTVTLTHPYHLVNVSTTTPFFHFFDYLVSFFFWLDVAVHLSTGDKIEEGVPMTFKQTSTQQMKSFWFALDVLSALPIFEFVGNGSFTGINKLLKLPKLFRVLKSMEEVAVHHSDVLRLSAYLLMILLAAYLLASLQQGYMCIVFEYCEVTDLSDSPFWSKTPLNNSNIPTRVVFSLYWAISMIDITQHKTASWAWGVWQNRVYTMAVIEGCMVLHVFIEAAYSATIMVSLSIRQQYETCILDVKNFLIRNNVDPMLRHRFINYLQLCWHTDMAYAITHKKQSVIYDLPKHVAGELLDKQRSKYILGIPFMKYVSAADLMEISSAARLFYTSPNEILLSSGDISNEMYVIRQGICEVFNPVTRKIVDVISTKNHFGVLECLLRIPSFYTVRAVTHVQVLTISSRSLDNVLNDPRIKDAIAFSRTQEEYTRLIEPRNAFIRYKVLPPAPNRSHFPLPRKYQMDINFLEPFNRLGYLSVLRYVFPRWTIRPDGKYMQRYEWFRAICALLTSIIFPCYTYMWLQFPWLQYFYYILDYCAYYDIIQRMLVGYYDEKGILVYHPASTAAHYLKGAFIVDLFGSLPLEMLDKGRIRFFEMNDKYQLLSTVQCLMFNRLMQLYRLPSALNTLSNCIGREDILLIIKGTPLFMALLNAMASSIVYESGEIFSPIEGGEFVFVPKSNQSWYKTQPIFLRYTVDESPFNLHLTAYFWAVYETTTTGYNTFNPCNNTVAEIIFVGSIIGLMLTTYFTVRVISIRANVNQSLAAFQDHMRDIAQYMQREKLPMDLRREVFRYYTYNWDRLAGTDYRSVLKLCDQITLRTDAILHIYGNTFAQCPVLAGCDHSLLRLLGRAVHSVYFLRDMTVIRKNDVIKEMYFVDYGTMTVIDSHDEYSNIAELHRGSMFGNLEDEKTYRCRNSFVAKANVHLLKIRTEVFYRIVRDFPAVVDRMLLNRPNKENYIVCRLRRTTSFMNLNLNVDRDTIEDARESVEGKGYWRYFEAHSNILHTYLITISLLVFYLDIYNAAFENNSAGMLTTLYLLDIAFSVKIIIRFVLPYTYNSREDQYYMLEERKMYFIKDMKYDIISCVPIEIFAYFIPDKWSYFGFLRLNRVFRIATVNQCLRRHNEKLHINLVLSTLTSVAIYFTIFMHTTSCIWFYIGELADYEQPNSSWRNVGASVPPCQSPYLCSLYFSMTTFMQDGVGDILPKVRLEVVFCCLMQIVSRMLCMIYVGEFSNIIQYESFRSFNYYTTYVEMKEFLQSNRVARTLVRMVNKYALHLWQATRGVQVPHFLELAPQCLQTKIMSAAYLQHLESHRVFKCCEPAFIRQLVRHFQMFTYSEGVYVVKENEITDAMYFIHRGAVEKKSEDIECTVFCLKQGKSFGTFQGLFHDTPYDFSYMVTGKAEVLTLCLKDWEYLLEHFPKSKEAIYMEFARSGPSKDDFNFPPLQRKRVQISPDATTEEKSKNTKIKKINRIFMSVSDKKVTLSPIEASEDTSLPEPEFPLTTILTPPKSPSKESSSISLGRMGSMYPLESRRRISTLNESFIISETSKSTKSRSTIGEKISSRSSIDRKILLRDASKQQGLAINEVYHRSSSSIHDQNIPASQENLQHGAQSSPIIQEPQRAQSAAGFLGGLAPGFEQLLQDTDRWEALNTQSTWSRQEVEKTEIQIKKPIKRVQEKLRKEQGIKIKDEEDPLPLDHSSEDQSSSKSPPVKSETQSLSSVFAPGSKPLQITGSQIETNLQPVATAKKEIQLRPQTAKASPGSPSMGGLIVPGPKSLSPADKPQTNKSSLISQIDLKEIKLAKEIGPLSQQPSEPSSIGLLATSTLQVKESPTEQSPTSSQIIDIKEIKTEKEVQQQPPEHSSLGLLVPSTLQVRKLPAEQSPTSSQIDDTNEIKNKKEMPQQPTERSFTGELLTPSPWQSRESPAEQSPTGSQLNDLKEIKIVKEFQPVAQQPSEPSSTGGLLAPEILQDRKSLAEEIPKSSQLDNLTEIKIEKNVKRVTVRDDRLVIKDDDSSIHQVIQSKEQISPELPLALPSGIKEQDKNIQGEIASQEHQSTAQSLQSADSQLATPGPSSKPLLKATTSQEEGGPTSSIQDELRESETNTRKEAKASKKKTSQTSSHDEEPKS